MRAFLIAGSTLLVALSSLVSAVPASAYVATQACSTITTVPSTGPGGTVITVTITLKGGPNCSQNVAGQQVTFSQLSGPAGCTLIFSSTTATTDANGQASITVTLPANCPGTFVVGASAPGVTLSATVRETGGFPTSSGSGSPVPAGGLPWIALLAVAGGLVLVGGAGLVLRRR